MRHGTKSKNEPTTLSPHGLESDEVFLQMKHDGVPLTLDEYLGYSGLDREDLNDADVRSSLPQPVQDALDAEEASDL